MAEKKTVRRKRQYSRNGCTECKRRKLKCDEAKPECWQCSHLGKSCVYVKSIKFSESRNVTLKVEEDESAKKKRSPLYGIISFDNRTMEKRAKQQEDQLSLSSSSSSYISPGEDRQNIIAEASTLANDIIESIDPQLDDFILDLTIPDYVKRQNVLDSFNLSEPHKTHLEIFYDKISAWLMPLEQNLCNEILLSHAQNCPYILAAMLSLSIKDEYRLKYISTCLKNISEVFQDPKNILSNIEPLILTVLLLAADSSSHNWRAHLRGAKDLFTKYIKFYTTPSLLLAKSWFAAIEILAGLQSVGTGKAHELDSLLDVGLYGESSEFAIDIGLLLPNGYNLFLGYSTEAIIMYREFIKLHEVKSSDILFQMSLIHNAKEFQVASDKIIIPKENPSHPDYEDDDKVILPLSCYYFHKDQVYSWFDLIHHLHVDALLLKAYTEFLKMDKTFALCQDVVKSMLGMCFFYDDDDDAMKIRDNEDSRLLMLQGPMLTCGLNCIDEVDKMKVETYFQNLIGNGVQSAKESFKRVQSCWEGNTDHQGQVEMVPFA